MTDRADFAAPRRALDGWRYLLVSVVPWYRDAAGRIWIGRLWWRDLMRHRAYIGDLTVLAPLRAFDPAEDLVPLDPMPPGLAFRALPDSLSLRAALCDAPAAIAAAWAAVRQADIVHSGAGGWPIPPGLYVNPIARVLRRPLVIVIESAFWRLSGPGPHRVAVRLRARVIEGLARWSVRRAILSVFTHEGYRATLGQGARGRLLVAPASWVDEGDLVPDPAAATAARGGDVRLLFAGRIVAEKGVGTLIEALRIAEAAGHPLRLDVIGEGAMRPALAALAEELRKVRLRLRDPVPYGAPFLSLLDGYHALVVPSLSDEQPRVLYDAAARAMAALASDTPGHRQVVRADVTGWFHPPGDAAALAAAMARAQGDPAALAAMGQAARAHVAGATLEAMHLARAQALADVLPPQRTRRSRGS